MMDVKLTESQHWLIEQLGTGRLALHHSVYNTSGPYYVRPAIRPIAKATVDALVGKGLLDLVPGGPHSPDSFKLSGTGQAWHQANPLAARLIEDLRLSPAQRRLVDKIRGGATLWRAATNPGVNPDNQLPLYFLTPQGGRRSEPVAAATVSRLLERGTLIQDTHGHHTPGAPLALA